MKKLFTQVFTILFIVGCNSNPETQFASASTVAAEDSTDLNVEPPPAPDPPKELSLEDIIKGYTDLYAKPEKFDSAFFVGADTYQIEFYHFCLFDKGVIVDSPYVGRYQMGRFVTHNFASQITILKNGKPLFKKYITKKDFDGKVEKALIKEGVLLFPDFNFSNNTFFFTYNLSIPITHVGIPVECKLDLQGNTEFYALKVEKEFD